MRIVPKEISIPYLRKFLKAPPPPAPAPEPPKKEYIWIYDSKDCVVMILDHYSRIIDRYNPNRLDNFNPKAIAAEMKMLKNVVDAADKEDAHKLIEAALKEEQKDA